MARPRSDEAAPRDRRGRDAERPRDIPKPGWKDILLRSWKEVGEDQIPLVSAGVAFYTLLSLFPGLAALVSLYGLFADVETARKQLHILSLILPPGVDDLIGDQMLRLAAAKTRGLSLASIAGLLVSVWSANGALKGLITGLNIAYEEKERRGFLRRTLTSLAFTVGFLAFVLLAIAMMTAPPAVLEVAGPGPAILLAAIGWPSLVLLLGLGLALLYRYGPSRDPVRWRWISWGSGLAVLLWLAASALFSVYVSNFAHYDDAYGPLGAVVGFMTWAWISSMVILIGAELNSGIEHQTAKDTTVGPNRPLGARGAVMADTIGEAQPGTGAAARGRRPKNDPDLREAAELKPPSNS